MNVIVQYYPAFCEGFEVQIVPFDTLEELLAIPFVASFAKDPGFDRFSKSDEMLMAEYKNPRQWWCVGTLKNPSAIDLPTLDTSK